MDRWFEILMSVLGGLSLLGLTLIVFILRGFSDRIMRLEDYIIGKSVTSFVGRRMRGAVEHGS